MPSSVGRRPYSSCRYIVLHDRYAQYQTAMLVGTVVPPFARPLSDVHIFLWRVCR